MNYKVGLAQCTKITTFYFVITQKPAPKEESQPPQQPPAKTQPMAGAKPTPFMQAKQQPTEVKEEKVAAQQQRPEESKAPPKEVRGTLE